MSKLTIDNFQDIIVLLKTLLNAPELIEPNKLSKSERSDKRKD